tara:strand:+ start:196 stop:366 length:171 start_codon:yes stop_codon:yes gene_type:complete
MSKQTEDTLNRIYHKVKEKKLKRKFDAQLKKMGSQEKHKYKDICEKWEYAYHKVQK